MRRFKLCSSHRCCLCASPLPQRNVWKAQSISVPFHSSQLGAGHFFSGELSHPATPSCSTGWEAARHGNLCQNGVGLKPKSTPKEEEDQWLNGIERSCWLAFVSSIHGSHSLSNPSAVRIKDRFTWFTKVPSAYSAAVGFLWTERVSHG